jgi:hypothetical protein
MQRDILADTVFSVTDDLQGRALPRKTTIIAWVNLRVGRMKDA